MTQLKKTADFNASLRQVVRLVKSRRNFLLTTHVNPDGDGLGAQSALYLALKKLGKKVSVANHDPLPKRFRFLPFSKIYRTSDRVPPHDVCFVLDAGDFSRIREGVSRSEFKTLVNIDHHYSNDYYGDYNMVLPESPATGEVVHRLIRALGVPVGKGIAESVYTSLVTDTGGFRYSNTTPEVLRLAASLVEAGADNQKVCDQVFAGVSPEAMELVRLSLGTVRVHQQGRVGTMTLRLKDFKKSGASDEDTENLINYVRKLEKVQIAIFLKERHDGLVKLSIRSRNGANVAKIAKLFGGGGHSYAAGAVLRGSLNQALERVLEASRTLLG